MKLLKIKFLALCLFILAFGVSCEEDIVPQDGPNGITGNFDIDLFVQNIVARLDGNTTGYAYSVSQAGVQYAADAGGDAVASWERTGSVDHHEDKRQDIASVSKPLTAMTLLHLLDENNKSVDDKLSDFVPSHWETPQGGSIHKKTLRQLLTHTSDFPQIGIDYNDLRNLYEDGGLYINDDYEYNNSNYAMLRVVIATLYKPTEVENLVQAALISNNEATLEALIGVYYIEAVNEIVLAPSGVAEATMNPADETDPTMNYNFNTNDMGWNKGDMRLWGGSAGWRLSASELNSIIATLTHTEKILSNATKDAMDDGLLGWSTDGNFDVTGGRAYGHGGFHLDGVSPNAASDPAGRGMYAIMIKFPNNIECAVVVNSLGGTNNMENEILPAFNDAWVN